MKKKYVFILMMVCVTMVTANEFIKKTKTSREKRISKNTLKSNIGYALKENMEINAKKRACVADIDQITLRITQDLLEQKKDTVLAKAQYRNLQHHLAHIEQMNERLEKELQELKTYATWLHSIVG